MKFADLFKKYLTAKPAAYGPLYDAIAVSGPVLEAGVNGGGSLLAWTDRWDVEVYGIDVTLDNVQPVVFAHPRVHLCVADATALLPPDLASMTFSLIIDDADHELSSQRAVLANLVRRLAHGGTYVLEDILTERGLAVLRADAAALGLVEQAVLLPTGMRHPRGLTFRVLVLGKP